MPGRHSTAEPSYGEENTEREISQTQSDNSSVVSIVCRVYRNKTNKLTEELVETGGCRALWVGEGPRLLVMAE